MESQLADTVGTYLLLARINEDHIKDPVEQYEVPCIAKDIEGLRTFKNCSEKELMQIELPWVARVI